MPASTDALDDGRVCATIGRGVRAESTHTTHTHTHTTHTHTHTHTRTHQHIARFAQTTTPPLRDDGGRWGTGSRQEKRRLRCGRTPNTESDPRGLGHAPGCDGSVFACCRTASAGRSAPASRGLRLSLSPGARRAPLVRSRLSTAPLARAVAPVCVIERRALFGSVFRHRVTSVINFWFVSRLKKLQQRPTVIGRCPEAASEFRWWLDLESVLMTLSDSSSDS